MINIKEIDKELSLKLGDPVESNEDGKIFQADTRLVYISNAIGRLYRILPAIMRVYAPLFASGFIYHEQKISQATNIKLITSEGKELSLENLTELFVTYNVKESENVIQKTTKATFIDPDKYLSVLNADNSAYEPSFKEGNIYYTFLNHSIYLLPNEKEYVRLYAVLNEDAPELTFETDSVKIPTKYKDLVLLYAAMEGMEDLGRTDKVQLYAGDINYQLSILKAAADFRTMKEGSEVNG